MGYLYALQLKFRESGQLISLKGKIGHSEIAGKNKTIAII